MSKPVCESCKGTGHDRHSQPVVETKWINAPDAESGATVKKKVYKTVRLGSGCLECGGKVV